MDLENKNLDKKEFYQKYIKVPGMPYYEALSEESKDLIGKMLSYQFFVLRKKLIF